MKAHLPLLFATLALALPALAAEGTFDRTLTVNGPVNLSVSSGSGYIHIYSGSDTQVHIIGRVHTRDSWFGSDSEANLKQIMDAPPIQQSGSSITIGKIGSSGVFQNVSIDYEITTPHATTLTAHSGSGSLEIGGLQGPVTANTGSGSIHVDNIGGNSHFGTGSGRILATAVHGAATAQTGSGSIDLIVDGSGDVRARTGSGSIQISGVNGGVQAAAGSGSIRIGGTPTFEWRAETGSGSVHLQVPPQARFNVEAHSGSGSIHVNRPMTMQGSVSQHRVSGTVNGGGPTLRVGTGSGSITIE